MGLGNRGWSDHRENYVDGYNIRVVGSTATGAVGTIDISQPAILYSITLALNPSVGSGDVSFRDGPGTATAGAVLQRFLVSSAASQVYKLHATFPRGLVMSGGIIVSATTVTGDINFTYVMRSP